MMNYGCLYLIPTPLGEYPPQEVLTPSVLETVCRLDTFIVEELRSARRFLSAAGLKGHIQDLRLAELNEHSTQDEVEALLPLFEGHDVGLISEAGLPAVADPGALAVELCHRHGIKVCPLVGPSSLMLALMGSGLNGQSFAFCGYLPAKTDLRRSAIRSIEKASRAMNQTQIFIETPYRSDAMLADLAQTLSPSTRICIAAELTLPGQTIFTMSAADWKKHIADGFQIGKRPCVFLILSQ